MDKHATRLALIASLALGALALAAADSPAKGLSWIATDSPFGSPTVMLERDGFILYVDPSYLPDGKSLPKADYILVTHSHSDHFDMAALGELSKPTTVFILPGDASWKLEDAGYGHVVTLEPEGTWKDKRIAVEAVPMDTGGDDTAHPLGMGWIGFILGVGGRRYYFSGDSGLGPDVQGLKNIDLAVINMNKQYMTGAGGVIAWAAKVKPKALALVHTVAGVDDAERAKAEAGLPKGTAFIELPVR